MVVLSSTEVKAQFDTIVFSKAGYFLYESIVYMGDQNDDGYDDFVLSIRPDPNSQAANAMFFRGGNPISSVPVFSIPVSYPRAVTATDWNRDGYRDIVIATDARPSPVKINIYYGGPAIDTLPDYTFQFKFADSSNNFLLFKGQNWPIDFNGDGLEELVASNSMTPTKSGSIIFFETDDTDTLPSYHMLSDTNNAYYYSGNHSAVFQQFADIDGDGCTDISMEYLPVNIPDREFRKFYYGNPSFAFSDTFKIFDTTHIIAIPDMNGDSKGERITLNYGSPFPYWYTIVMSFGTKPPNLSTDAGLNLQNSSYTYITSRGDVNHDGFNDFIVHVSYYLARLFLGGNPIPTEKADEYSFNPDNSPNFSGRIGDVTGDGVDDICIGEEAEYQGFPHTNRVYIMKGVRKPTGVEDDITTANLPTEFSISNNYPNPFNPSTKVRIATVENSVLTFTLFNSNGEEVSSFTKEYAAKGNYEEEINLSGLPSGAWFLSVRGENGKQIKLLKLLYLK
ncbi:MAG: T9SS type A sorting domain-containing protein [Ignavibacteriales bacterium]|nr:T9SS type A sorting domain-containing protein [Ignavibacteriales bacterium]